MKNYGECHTPVLGAYDWISLTNRVVQANGIFYFYTACNLCCEKFPSKVVWIWAKNKRKAANCGGTRTFTISSSNACRFWIYSAQRCFTLSQFTLTLNNIYRHSRARKGAWGRSPARLQRFGKTFYVFGQEIKYFTSTNKVCCEV